MDIKELKSYLKSLPNILDDQGDFRHERAQNDFYYFATPYFAHQLGIEDKVGLSNFKEHSKFRLFVYNKLENVCEDSRCVLIEAYRGGAKTTLITRLYLLWQLLSGRKNYPYHAVIQSLAVAHGQKELRHSG